MTRRREAIESALQAARQREEEAGAIVNRHRASLDQAALQLSTLQGYADDYRPAPTQAHSAPQQLRNAREFLARLNEAVDAQRRRIGEMEEVLAAAQAPWLAARRDVEALERVLERLAAEERRSDARREQHELDDLSLRAIVARRPV